jgi:hypothetical protein
VIRIAREFKIPIRYVGSVRGWTTCGLLTRRNSCRRCSTETPAGQGSCRGGTEAKRCGAHLCDRRHPRLPLSSGGALWAGSKLRPGTDTVVFIGDYIDRGRIPGCRRVRPGAPAADSRRSSCLMGNHERMFLDYLEEPRGGGDVSGKRRCRHAPLLWALEGGAGGDRTIFRGVPRFFTSLSLLYRRSGISSSTRACGRVSPWRSRIPGILSGSGGSSSIRRDLRQDRRLRPHPPAGNLTWTGPRSASTRGVLRRPVTCVELPAMRFHTAQGAEH